MPEINIKLIIKYIVEPYITVEYMSLVVESKVGKKRIVVIPKIIAEAVGIREGQKIRIIAAKDKIVIEPIRDAIWLALYGKKIGEIKPEEIEDESLREQEKIAGQQDTA